MICDHSCVLNMALPRYGILCRVVFTTLYAILWKTDLVFKSEKLVSVSSLDLDQIKKLSNNISYQEFVSRRLPPILNSCLIGRLIDLVIFRNTFPGSCVFLVTVSQSVLLITHLQFRIN